MSAITVTWVLHDGAQITAAVAPGTSMMQAAIAANDSAVLDSSFWDDPRVVRYGITELLYGIEAIRAFRASVKSYAPRAQKKITITTFGRDFATTNLEFHGCFKWLQIINYILFRCCINN